MNKETIVASAFIVQSSVVHSMRPWYGNGVRLGARGVGGCDRALLNCLRTVRELSVTAGILCFPESLNCFSTTW